MKTLIYSIAALLVASPFLSFTKRLLRQKAGSALLPFLIARYLSICRP
jgi:hypothetical protein